MLEEHLGYVADRIRLERFRIGIGQVIHPGDQVADLGCGSGILGLLCLRAGGGRVYGVDSTAMIEVARETFLRAGLAEQVTLVRGHSHRVALPEPVDLVICDHVGYFGFDYGIIHTLQDARRRFLKAGASSGDSLLNEFRGQFTQLRRTRGVGSCNPAPVHSDIRLPRLR